jgi:putative copper export protein
VRAFAEWLYGTAPSVAVHSTFWLIRLLQAAHLLTAGVAVASGAMIALRALGWQRADQPFETVWKRFAPWLAASLAVMAATGIAQTLGDPVREFTATSYWLKLALLVCCALGTLLLSRAARRMPRMEFSFPAKVAAAALLLCWLALPLLGRMIGYDLAIFGSLSLRT